MTVELRLMPCAEFELAIHSYVDGEIAQTEAKDLLVHIELCRRCSDALELVRREVRTHRDVVATEDFLAGFDSQGFFRTLNGTLLAGNVGKIAELLYELGKAYFLSASDSKLAIFIHKKALAIERTRGEGRRLVRETAEVGGRSDAPATRTRQTLRRAEQLFRGRTGGRGARIGRSSTGRTALDNARRFLEEALILNPQLPKARYYLGIYFHRCDRPDEAMAEYRKILGIPGLEASLRALTLQAMGNAYAYRRDYDKAIACYEQILSEGLVDRDPKFFHVLVGLSMHYAKAGRFERSKELFGELVSKYPDQLEDARGTLRHAQVFHQLLKEEAWFHTELRERYPMLFAG